VVSRIQFSYLSAG